MVLVVLGAVADLLDRRILRRVVDQGGVDHQGRVVAVVGRIVIGEGKALRAVELGAVILAHHERRPAVGRAVVQHDAAEMVGAAGYIDLVTVGFLFVGAGQGDVSRGGEAGRMGRVRRVAQVVIGQPVLLHGLGVAGDIRPQIITVAVVGIEIELAAIAEAPPVIVVAAKLDVRVGPVDSRVVVVFFDVVEAPSVGSPRCGQHERERSGIGHPACARLIRAGLSLDDQVATVEAETAADHGFKIERPGVPVHGLVAPARRGLRERPVDGRSRARRQVDRPAEALGLMVRQGRLVDHQAVDGAGGDGVVFHGAAAAPEIGAARIGVQQRHPAEGRTRQVSVDPSDVHEPAFAGVGGDRDAGYAAQGLGRVEVGVLQDGLGGLNVDDVRRFELPLASQVLLPWRSHHHIVGLASRRRRGRALGVGACGEKEGAGRHQRAIDQILGQGSVPSSIRLLKDEY